MVWRRFSFTIFTWLRLAPLDQSATVILIILIIEIGLITPPLGLNVYTIKGVMPDIPLGEIFSGASRLLIAEIITLILLIAFPDIALFLPNTMQGR